LPPTTVSVRTSVKEAAQLMKENHTTAVLVQDQGAITGIFTSKDVVLRVIAAGLDPSTCSVVRVMTPHPDFAPMDMSIQAALRKMHDGHYLNLPVMSEAGEIVGMVDVLKLTYATLDQVKVLHRPCSLLNLTHEQINSMQSNDSEGPAWNKFWMSLENETESIMSGDGSHRPPQTPDERSFTSPGDTRPGPPDRGDSVMPHDSASHHGVESPDHSNIVPQSPDAPFPFKFKAPSGRMHRIQLVATSGIAELVTSVAQKLGTEIDQIGGMPVVEDGALGKSGFALSYLDNEGDTVSITTDRDLLEAVTLARQSHHDKVDLFVHDPEKPPVSATLDPQPVLSKPLTPPVSTLRERKRYEEDEDQSTEEGSERPRRERKYQSTSFQQEQFIQGIPNELLLPGAIVTLAAVIVGIFVISRTTSR
jgi:hypothetical protein